MASCVGSISDCFSSVRHPEISRRELDKSMRTHAIVACALIALCLVMIGLSRIGTGMGYMPATRMTGFGFIYHFAAMHVFFVGAGIGLVGLGFAASSVLKARSLQLL
jgi:hypothetical protein